MALTQDYEKTITFLPIDDEYFVNKLDEKKRTKTEKVIIKNAYYKIKQVEGNKTKINIEIGIYEQKGGKLLETRQYQYQPDVSDNSENFLKQGYEFLKTLQEYSDSSDC